MNRKHTGTIIVAAALLTAGAVPAWAQNSELEQLKQSMKAMEQTMEQMKQKIAELERAKAQAPVAVTNALEASSPSIQTLEKVAAGQHVSEQSPITYRGAF